MNSSSSKKEIRILGVETMKNDKKIITGTDVGIVCSGIGIICNLIVIVMVIIEKDINILMPIGFTILNILMLLTNMKNKKNKQ